MKKLDKTGRNLVLGMSIGDGYLNKSNYLSIRHSEKQLDYLKWKKDLLNKNGIKTTDIYWVSNNKYGAYEFRTKSYKFIHLLRSLLYTPKKTISNPKVLSKLTPEMIAIWYMDDGSISTQKRNGNPYRTLITICTCISKEENQVIIDYFNDTWGIKMNQRKMKNQYALVISSKENVVNFLNLIKPFILQVPCMNYKLNCIYSM